MRDEWQQAEEDGGLLGQGLGAMVRILSIHASHIVDVVVFHRVDELVDELLVQLEAGDVLAGVLIGDRLRAGEPIDCVACLFDQLAHFGVVVRSC